MSYVQYGCGYSAPVEWINFDRSPTMRFERVPLLGKLVKKNASRFPPNVMVGDIVTGLPIPDASADGVYASHVLEHLARSDFDVALRNTFKIMKPGAILRLIVPDLEARARQYIARLEAEEKDANDWFMLAAHLGLPAPPATATEKISRLFGGSLHLWMWDFPSLETQLEKSGFVDIRRCAVGDSGDPMFALVEEATRFFDQKNGIKELAIQAIRPTV